MKQLTIEASAIARVRSAGRGNVKANEARGTHPRKRRARAGWLVLAAILCACAAAPSAYAASGADANTTMALAKFDIGRKAFEAGKFEEALLAFQESYSLSASPNSELFIARCFRALGKVASAYTSYKRAAHEAQDRLTSTGEKRYGATRDAAASEGAELEPKVPRVTLVVPGGTPEGFWVKENGNDVPKEGWGIAVETDPGSVTIEAGGPRLVPWKRVITLAEGVQTRVDVEAKRLPTATILISLASLPSGLAITVDGAPIDVGNARAPREVDVGPHEVVVRAPGYRPFTWNQPLADGDRTKVDVVLKEDARSTGTPKWLFFATGAVGVAGLAAASGIAADAKSLSDTQNALDPLQRSQSAKNQIGTLSTTANVLFVTGGLFAAGAVVLAFTTKWHSAESSEQTSLAPWVGPGGGGLAAMGTF
jgi:hypothetical protein